MVNYIEAKKTNDNIEVIHSHHNVACYNKIFGRGVALDANFIILYDTNCYFNNVETIALYVKYLNMAGFPCAYEGCGRKIFDCIPDHSLYHTYTIDLTKYKYKHHLTSTLTLLRYVFEQGFYDFLSHFINIMKLKKLGALNSIILASNLFNNHGGHALTNMYGIAPQTLKELMAKFEKTGTIFESNGRSMQDCWSTKKRILIKSNLTYMSNINRMKEGPRLVFIVGGATNYVNWLENIKLTKNIEEADLVVFTGGEDVDPSLYGEPVGKHTTFNRARDLREKEVFKQAKHLSIPMLGICRGSQFLCVMNGGALVQHQENNKYIHKIDTTKYGTLSITSTHHQAAYPNTLDTWQYDVIAWAAEDDRSAVHLNGHNNNINVDKEAEIVYYRDHNCLGIQGHPEHEVFQKEHPDTIKQLRKILKDTINF